MSQPSQSRVEDTHRFYVLLDRLQEATGGVRRLSECHGRLDWPDRGVYFFFEDGEKRSASGNGGRVVRVGTHALKHGSRTRLWSRLSQHRGTAQSHGGNHRGSIFRLLIGTALMERDQLSCGTWGAGSSAPAEIRKSERELESHVSRVIGQMSLTWLDIDDDPSPSSLRGYIERNSIALLSNFNAEAADSPSPDWLGRHCNRLRVKQAGLWNQNHVDEQYDPAFLDTF